MVAEQSMIGNPPPPSTPRQQNIRTPSASPPPTPVSSYTCHHTYSFSPVKSWKRCRGAHCSGLNIFFSSRHCVGRGEDGPNTPCSRASAWAGADMVGPAWGGGPGRAMGGSMGGGANAAGAPFCPASRFMSAFLALEFSRMPPPSSARNTLFSLLRSLSQDQDPDTPVLLILSSDPKEMVCAKPACKHCGVICCLLMPCQQGIQQQRDGKLHCYCQALLQSA